MPIWHLVWMGLWTGYIMALVGQAAGIFALPYSTSVLQFDNPHVTPTMLVLTLFNPVGALLGFRRSGQWNLNFAAAVCAGGFLGGVIGPFLRATVLARPENFRATLGVALALFGLQLCYRALADYGRYGSQGGMRSFDARASQEMTSNFRIETAFQSFSRIAIRYGGRVPPVVEPASIRRRACGRDFFFSDRSRRWISPGPYLRLGVAAADLRHGSCDHSIHSDPFARRNTHFHVLAAACRHAGVVGVVCRRRRRLRLVVGFKNPGPRSRTFPRTFSRFGDERCRLILRLECRGSPLDLHVPSSNHCRQCQDDKRHSSVCGAFPLRSS